MVDGSNLITVAEAARRLSRSTEQVRRYLREQRLQGQRIGGQWFIDQAELSAFEADQAAQRGFFVRLRSQPDDDPLGATIALTHGRGSNMADGKAAYTRSYRRH